MILTAEEKEWARQLAAFQNRQIAIGQDDMMSSRDQSAEARRCSDHIDRLKGLLKEAMSQAAGVQL